MRRWIARWLYPRAFEDQEAFTRLWVAVQEATLTLGYDYPSIEVLGSWLRAQIEPWNRPNVGDLQQALREVVGEDEAEELATRVQRALDRANETKH